MLKAIEHNTRRLKMHQEFFILLYYIYIYYYYSWLDEQIVVDLWPLWMAFFTAVRVMCTAEDLLCTFPPQVLSGDTDDLSCSWHTAPSRTFLEKWLGCRGFSPAGLPQDFCRCGVVHFHCTHWSGGWCSAAGSRMNTECDAECRLSEVTVALWNFTV